MTGVQTCALPIFDEIFGRLTNVASTLQDLSKGRRTEIDHLNGAVAALGAGYGIDCPVNRALTAIIKALEGAPRAPGP